jgi:hypothetical protein
MSISEPEQLTFKCISIVIAQKGQTMDQISLFPELPAASEVYQDEFISKENPLPSPQMIVMASHDRGHVWAKEALNVNIQTNKSLGINKEFTWNILGAIILQKAGSMDQIILYTDLPRAVKDPTKKNTPVAILMDEGFGARYAMDVLKLTEFSVREL